MTGWSLAIDFGTSNTAASYRVGRGPARPVQLSDQSHQMPSAVLVTEDGIRVGTEALRARGLSPDGFEESPKLRLGQDTMLVGDQEVEVVDLVAAVLGHAARRAQRAAGGSPPTSVLLTHPYEWAGPRRSALLAAWERAGVRAGRVELVSEPLAAVSWFVETATPPEGSHVGVLDVGGGTCDVAVVLLTGDPARPLEVVGHGGQADLGGRTIDVLLLNHIRRLLVSSGRGELDQALSSPENVRASRTLLDHVRQAKHALAEWEDAAVPVVVGAQEATLTVTAAELVRLVEPVVERMRDLTRRTMLGAGVRPEEVQALYLTGGSSQLRPVATALGALIGGRPATLDDPKMVVALGAHYAAGLVRRAGGSVSTLEAADGPGEVHRAPTPRAPTPREPGPVPTGQPRPQPQPLDEPAEADQGSAPHPVLKPGYGRRSPARWLIPVAVAVAAVVGVFLLLPAMQRDPGRAGGEPSASPSPTSPTAGPTAGPSAGPPSGPTPTPSSVDRLRALVPPGAGTCVESDAKTGSASVTCETTYVGSTGPVSLTSSFTLVADEDALDAHFEDAVGTRILGQAADCPKKVGSGNYQFVADVPVGRLACFRADDSPVLIWTRTESLVVGEIRGESGTDLPAVWEWWVQLDSRIGAR